MTRSSPAVRVRPASRSDADGALLLGSPRRVLGRLAEGDPLDLRERVGRRLRARALLVDGERVRVRTLALVAHEAPLWRGGDLDAFVDGRVDEAIEQTLLAERDAFVLGAVDDAPSSDVFLALATPLGLEARMLRAACVRFAAEPFEVREAFFRIVVEATPPERAARALGESLVTTARHARRGLAALLGRKRSLEESR